MSQPPATTTSMSVANIPLALYIHIPWCVKKCPYCDFNSHQLTGEEAFAEYVDTLLADATMQVPFAQARKLSSIFIGGGTPSLLPISEYQRLFAGLRRRFVFANDIEVTMEANPGTLEHAPFAEYLAVGINRLSIGVQSFDENKLHALGRIHDRSQALQAIKAARAAGFNRVNVDLMHGLPEQTAAQAVEDIQLAHDAGATHLSWYQLTIEPNTVFYRNTPILPSEDELGDIEQAGMATLQALGYRNYEISAWVGGHDRECQHNVNYWQFGDYLAIGAGAHGKVSFGSDVGIDLSTCTISTINAASQLSSTYQDQQEVTEQDDVNDYVNKDIDQTPMASGIYRFSKSRLPKDYMQQVSMLSPQTLLEKQEVNQEAKHQETHDTPHKTIQAPKMVGWQKIDAEELVSEYMLNVLRLTDGVPLSYLPERTGVALASIQPMIDKLQEQGLLQPSTDRLATTALGRRYLNHVLQEFL